MFQYEQVIIQFSIFLIGIVASQLNCLNGGTLINDQYCSCPVGYHGLECNGTVCPLQMFENPVGSGNCMCYPGFTGQNCDEIEKCWNDFPMSQGACDCSGNEMYAGLFFGTLCDQFDCEHERLHCLPGTTHWNLETLETTCECRPPYDGIYCEKIGDCYHGGTPYEETVNVSTYKYGGPPGQVFGEFPLPQTVPEVKAMCSCVPPFTGQFCEQLVCDNGKIIEATPDEDFGQYACRNSKI